MHCSHARPSPRTTQQTRPSGSDKHHGKGKKELFHILIKYAVAPEDAEDFVEAWQELQRETDREEGVQIYSLRKPLGDNYKVRARACAPPVLAQKQRPALHRAWHCRQAHMKLLSRHFFVAVFAVLRVRHL